MKRSHVLVLATVLAVAGVVGESAIASSSKRGTSPKRAPARLASSSQPRRSRSAAVARNEQRPHRQRSAEPERRRPHPRPRSGRRRRPRVRATMAAAAARRRQGRARQHRQRSSERERRRPDPRSRRWTTDGRPDDAPTLAVAGDRGHLCRVGAVARGGRVLAGARGRRRWVGLALWVFLIGNAVGILWIWGGGGADGLGYHWHSFDAVLVGLGRMTALLAGYLALVEVLLLARLPFLERLVGFDRLTIWHRRNGHAVLELVLAHVVFSVWGYARQDRHSFFARVLELADAAPARRREDRRSGGFSGTLSAAVSRHLPVPRHDHRDGRHRAPRRRRRDLGRRRAPQALLRVVVRDPLHRVRGDRALVVPHDPGRQRARDRPDRGRLLAQPLRARARARPLLPRRTTARAGRALRPAGHRGDRGGTGRRLAPDRRPGARAARRPGRPVLLLALPHRRLLVHEAPVLALGGARRRLVPDHRQEPRRPHLEARDDPGRNTRLRGGPVRGLHRREQGRRPRRS